MRGKLTLLASVCAGAIAFPAFAQTAEEAPAFDENTIIVTAQRTSERLQDVPIAVSAFSGEALERQQIKNTSDLQLTLPNVTFTKTNFTSSSFTIRGIGDLCVGVTCDSATAIHMNDAPLFGTRLFEGEFYDLAAIEVLRGPQGTLFGKNATSGVVNIKSARPDLARLGASAEAEYGNFNGVKIKGMINAPVGETIGVRLAGFYLSRDGYTKNLYDNSRIDDRNMFGLRGSLRFEPSSSTTIDLSAQYFHEKDNRMRIQKQLCQRDPTGVMGCLNARRDYSTTNANSTLGTIFASQEFFRIRGLPAGQTALTPNFSIGSLYGPDAYAGVVNPADPRVVNTDFKPTYFTKEWILQGKLDQELGGGLSLKLQGNYQDVKVDSSQDYNLSVQNRSQMAGGLTALANAAAGLYGAGLQAYLRPIANALIPNGAAGVLCTSAPDTTGMGVYGGNRVCANSPLDFDRSVQQQTSWTAEAIISSKWDGPFNFLLGGIYGKFHLTENSYYVDAFGLDYAAGVLGAFTALGGGIAPTSATSSYFLATPYYRNNSDDLRITTYGLFGEAYYEFSDKLKLTLGLRYNNDRKQIQARTTLFSFLTPTGGTNAFSSAYFGAYDADPGIAGNQPFAIRDKKFSAWTGRAVLNYNITDDNLLYASFSRGYKSGGINPPLSVGTNVPESFLPEFVNAFEVGSKNTFGKMQLNLTGFYYNYKDLQLSRIVNRTSVNDNVSANIYGLEAEAVFHPTRELSLNINASYLHTSVSQDKLLSNSRDFGAGRADAVIIKDITNAANCAVGSNTGNVAGVNSFVNTVNTFINVGAVPGVSAGAGLQPTTSFGAGSGLASTGAFSICAALNAAASGAFAAGGLDATALAALGGVTVYLSGIPTNIKGNKLPGAPDYKLSAGIQYAAPLGDLTLTPRLDVAYTGKTFGNIFNGTVNAIPSFTQVNAQIQLDGVDRKWFMRAFVQNLFDKNSITGLYVTDQSSGNYTNIFTLEPRRFGVAAGIKF
jgi:outer membrane receptor protein involved in Fe transport